MKRLILAIVSKYGTLFLCVLSIFCIAFCIFLFCANKEFRHSQEEIKESYVEHIRLADSLYYDMVAYNKEYSYRSSELNAAIFTDSLLKAIVVPNFGLSRKQYENLSAIVSRHFDDLQKLHTQYDGKLLHDSLLLSTERQLLEGQTKTMLDLHLNKIEHEYSNITMWAAVLTILFLVFSFYSIFKMDELIQQGNEGVNEIRKLKESGDNTIREIKDAEKTMKKEHADNLSNAKSELSTFMDNQQKIVSGTVEAVQLEISAIKSMSDQTIRDILANKEKMDSLLVDSVNALKDKLSEIETQYSAVLQPKVEELNSIIAKIQDKEERKEGEK